MTQNTVNRRKNSDACDCCGSTDNSVTALHVKFDLMNTTEASWRSTVCRLCSNEILNILRERLTWSRSIKDASAPERPRQPDS